MEKSGSKCTLLPTNELELSIDGTTRRKRKLCHCIFIANVLLCLISCTAAITCIVNYNLTLGEIERARSGLDERYNEILTAVHDEKPETIAENFEIDTEETDGEETEILVDRDTSVEIAETISSIENPPTETDEYYFDDAEEYISSGDDRNGDEVTDSYNIIQKSLLYYMYHTYCRIYSRYWATLIPHYTCSIICKSLYHNLWCV